MFVLFAFVSLFPLAVWAGPSNLEQLAKQLAELRTEVDQLQQELEQAKLNHRQKLEALGAQITQLEAEKRRQELALQKLQNELETAQKKTASAAQSNDPELVKPLQEAISALRRYIQDSLPFKQAERLEALKSLEAKLNEKASSPKKLTAELWALVEDELRLTRENGLYQQILPVDGNSALVETAKLGMVMLFFKTPDGRYGLAKRREDGWHYEIVSQTKDREDIAKLMDALRKQIRQGYFELPNPGIPNEL
ncbi:MAG: DUF3450 domain-containing protein [Methylohalobius sp.]|nr:DUF3450 domain-containing protein [Methylohalobius sp.]